MCMVKWKIICHPHTKYFMNKQSVKVTCRFDRLRTSYGKRWKAILALEKL